MTEGFLQEDASGAGRYAMAPDAGSRWLGGAYPTPADGAPPSHAAGVGQRHEQVLAALREAPQLPQEIRDRIDGVAVVGDRLEVLVVDSDGEPRRVVGHIIGPPADVMIDGRWWRVVRVTRTGGRWLVIEMEALDGC